MNLLNIPTILSIALIFVSANGTFANTFFNAEKEQFPYLARLEYTNSQWLCDGAIINEQWIVVKATCAWWASGNDLNIIVGSNNRNDGVLMYSVKAFYIHSNFCINNPSIYNIATVQITSNFEINFNVQPITLAEKNDIQINVQYVTWKSNYKQYFNTSAIDNNYCVPKFLYESTRQVVADGNLCTQPDQCQTNGLLIHDDELIGIGLFKDYAYSVQFARISYYRQWIVDHSPISDEN